jgi:hypothetical protein
MGLWFIAGSGALAAVVALLGVRRLRRRLEDLNQAYWELRYEHTRLRAQVARLDPGVSTPDPDAAAQLRSSPQVSYVSLSSLKAESPKS